MRVQIEIVPDCEEPHALLRVAQMTPSIQAAVSILEKEGAGGVFTARKDHKLYVLEAPSIEIFRTEGRELALYDLKGQRYIVSRTLYEIEELTGHDFFRISKSAIVNLRRIYHVEASFNGTMEIVMKNGITETITRSYKHKFKERLGV